MDRIIIGYRDAAEVQNLYEKFNDKFDNKFDDRYDDKYNDGYNDGYNDDKKRDGDNRDGQNHDGENRDSKTDADSREKTFGELISRFEYKFDELNRESESDNDLDKDSDNDSGKNSDKDSDKESESWYRDREYERNYDRESRSSFGGGNRQRPERKPVFAEEPTPARRVAEGAMLVASAVIFGLSTAYLPMLWLVAMFLWPIPLALLVRRFGPGFGLGGILLTGVLLAFFIGPVGALTMLINMGGVGFWYGYAARRGIKPAFTVLGGVVIAAISMVVLLLFSSAVAGLQMADIATQMRQFVDMYVGNLEKRGQLDAVLTQMSVEEYSELLTEYIMGMLPATVTMIAMTEAGIAYALNAYVFKRLGYPVEKLPPLHEWRMPWYTMWGLIIALACWIAVRMTGESETWTLIANNVMYVYQPLLMMSGLTLIFWQAIFWRMPWLNYMMLVMMICAFKAISPMLILLGLFDSIMDLRSVMRKRYFPGGERKY